MSDMMTFPDTWEEFEKSYGFTDNEEVYTNGSRLIPSFRVKQWVDHIAQHENKRQAIKSSDLINRENAIANVALEIWYYPNELYTTLNCFENCQELAERALNRLPSAEPKRKKGEWIKFNNSCTIQCDQCGQEMTSLCDIQLPNYCPNCGADMREGEEDED